MGNLKENLKKELRPLYEKLTDGKKISNICVFCMQWGDKFPEKENDGILFVGKAVNGWIHDKTDIDTLFGEDCHRIFARCDQMKWVHNLENDVKYNTKKSAFWRVVKAISQNFYPKNEWYANVAWSNLYKVAPYKGGNPDKKLRGEQVKLCVEILKKEIEILSPKFVVMLTSAWEKDFMFYLNDNSHTNSEEKINWDGHEIKILKIKDVVYITSQHPQGKNETDHVKAITDLIVKYGLSS